MCSQPVSYGSIYFASDAVRGAVPAEVINDVPADLKEKVLQRFAIGPSVDRDFWAAERSQRSDAVDYAMSIGHREIAWIQRYAIPKPPGDPLIESAAQNSPEAHIELLEKYLKIAPYLVQVDQDLQDSILWHDDLHGGNIFIHNNRIASVIDWQGIWAGPLLFRVRPSPGLNSSGPTLLKRPDNFEDLDDDEKAQTKRQISRSIMPQLYILETNKRNPALAKAFHLDHGKTRRHALIFSGNTWDEEILPFRQALIHVERYWEELGFKENCPIHFTDEELKSHIQDGKGWNELQDFFDNISGFVERDGWTSNEQYADALEFFSGLRRDILQDLTGKEKEDFERASRWADIGR
ncbi:conserved hypothetical protein [Paecilomyces variotii No. 5]|uniref:Altered inheritance of mitochondria protein 9, mitochondrial n=1 Tax=Byssochlamys spectabilis (strain No. 5 / NBRC 109023) TaxID=1356009 RepID=V5FJY8_BYSSN|nr:conserved hypothetical protein [Paecilomyces variotii No. 5]